MSRRGNDGLLAKAATFIYEWVRSEAAHGVTGIGRKGTSVYILEDLAKVRGVECVDEVYG